MKAVIMRYNDFELEDFLSNEEFIGWVKKPTKENEVFWNRWIELHPEKLETITKARSIVQSAWFANVEADPKRSGRILDDVIAQKYTRRNSDIIRQENKRRNKSVMLYIGSIAATVLLLITFFSYFNFHENWDQKEITPVQISKSNPSGQRSTIILPDSSIVKLNAESKIVYSSDFATNREVQLSGEAFFSVKKGEIPFRVHTAYLTTTVLGTKFNITAFSNEQNKSISLLEGSVKIENTRNAQTETSFLEPGERLVYDEMEDITYLNKLDADELAWKDGYLVFRDTGLHEFIQMIRRWYGVEVIIIGNKDPQWKINGKYKVSSLELLLENIKFTEDVDYRIKNKKVEIILN